jgi:type IV pilus assembly protein PilX
VSRPRALPMIRADVPWRGDRNPRRAVCPTCSTVSQRGVILFVALLATIAMTLGGVALVRAVATDAAIGANLAAREQATLAATAAVEDAVAALFEGGGIDTAADDPARRYFSWRQAGEDARGIPAALQSITNYPAGAPTLDGGDGVILRHVIERLCIGPGAATVDNCTLTPPSVAAALGTPPATEPPRTPYYRVTVRADAPGGTTLFVQAMLGEVPGQHRLSWRTLDE